VRDVIANQDADFPRQNVNPYIIVCGGEMGRPGGIVSSVTLMTPSVCSERTLTTIPKPPGSDGPPSGTMTFDIPSGDPWQRKLSIGPVKRGLENKV
jgi:hypothetical protein